MFLYFFFGKLFLQERKQVSEQSVGTREDSYFIFWRIPLENPKFLRLCFFLGENFSLPNPKGNFMFFAISPSPMVVLLTRMSIPPNISTVLSTKSCSVFSSVTSPYTCKIRASGTPSSISNSVVSCCGDRWIFGLKVEGVKMFFFWISTCLHPFRIPAVDDHRGAFLRKTYGCGLANAGCGT